MIERHDWNSPRCCQSCFITAIRVDTQPNPNHLCIITHAVCYIPQGCVTWAVQTQPTSLKPSLKWNVFKPCYAKVATIFSAGLTRKMTEYRLCMLRQEDGRSKKDRHDMSLLNHSPRGRASGFIRDERFTFVCFGCNHNERNQKHRSTALSGRRHPSCTHASTHTSTTTACLSAHEHTQTQRETNPWLLAAVTFTNVRWERSVHPTGSHEVKTFSFSLVLTLLFRSIPSWWMPSDRSKLVRVNTCLHYQHTSNKCAHRRTKTWWNPGRDDPCADSMLEACKF